MAILKRTYFAGVIGNALEWYDFTTYVFFAPIFAELFFPSKNPAVSLIMAFAVFALSFLIRPIGGLLFGYFGDHRGRRKALILSIICMSVPTLFIACLPGYQQIGFAAPLLLTLLRLLQGLAVSGELTSASAFLVEHSRFKNRGFVGSLAMCSAFIGITISAAISMVLGNIASHSQLLSWGWRLPFLIGGLLGLIGLIYRIRSTETILFQQSEITKIKTEKNILDHSIDILKEKYVWLAILVTAIMAVGNWFLIGYFNTFLIKIMGMHPGTVMTINFLCLLIFTLLLPVAGRASDSIGRKPVLLCGIIGIFVLSYPIFWLLNAGRAPFALLGELLFVIALAPIAATIPATLSELFHVKIRNTGMSLGYNISQAIFGGTAPLIALALVSKTGNHYAPMLYLIGCAFLSGLAVLFMQETAKSELK